MDDVGAKALNMLGIFQIHDVAGLLLLSVLCYFCHFLIAVLHDSIHGEVLVGAAPGSLLVDQSVSRVLLAVHGLTHAAARSFG